MTAVEVGRLDGLLDPAAARAHVVPGDPAPGLEAPAAADVRRGRGADRAPRPRPDRPGPDRRPALRPGPPAQGARGARSRRRRGRGRGTRPAPRRLGADSEARATLTVRPRDPRHVDHCPDAGLVVALDGPGSSGKSSVGAAAALRARLPLLRHGPALPRGDMARARTRGVAGAGDPAALVALVAGDRARRRRERAAGPRDGRRRATSPTRSTRRRVDEAVSAVSAGPGAARRAPRAPAGPGRAAGRDRHGRPRHRDGRAARRRPEDLPRRLGRGAGAAPRPRSANLDPDSPEARYILAQLRRRDELDTKPGGRAAAGRPTTPVHIVTDGNDFEQTVAAVVAAIRAAERARPLAAPPTPLAARRERDAARRPSRRSTRPSSSGAT